MLTATLALSLVALTATVDGSFQPPRSAEVLAQDAPPTSAAEPSAAEPSAAEPSAAEPSDDAMGDALPPPPPPAAVTPPPGARVVPPGDGKGPRARMEERRQKRAQEAEGLDPLLTGALQVGVGAATCGACGLGYCGASAALGLFVFAPLAVTLAAVPFLSTLIFGGVDLLLCGSLGATVGAAEVVVGNLFGQEEGSYLWPVLAGAGIGAGVSVTSTIITLALAVMNAGMPAPQPGEVVDPTAVLASTNPLALGLSLASVGVCAAGCLALPIVPALVYGLTAEPKNGTAQQVLHDEPTLPAAASRTAMAY